MTSTQRYSTSVMAGVLGAILFSVGSCAPTATQVPVTPVKSGPTFNATALGPSRSAVQFDVSHTRWQVGAALLLCRTAVLAIDRGFKYFRMENQRWESRGKGLFEVEFFLAPPPGVQVIRLGPPSPASEDEERKAVTDAASFLAGCKQMDPESGLPIR